MTKSYIKKVSFKLFLVFLGVERRSNLSPPPDRLVIIMPPPPRRGIKRCCCLSSDVCLSVAYIGPKSRTERSRRTKNGTDVAT